MDNIWHNVGVMALSCRSCLTREVLPDHCPIIQSTRTQTKMAVLQNVAPCSLVEIDRLLRAVYCPVSTRLHGATYSNRISFLVAAIRTWNGTHNLNELSTLSWTFCKTGTRQTSVMLASTAVRRECEGIRGHFVEIEVNFHTLVVS
jgi:hypothetical protein